MRVCQFAFIGSDNLGDEAIFETIYRDLSSLKPARLTVLSMNPERTRAIATGPNTEVLSARSLPQTLSAIRACDVFVCGGGGIFQDQTSIYNPARYLSRVEAALRFGKTVFIYGVSVGPLKHRANRLATGNVLRRAACITVRDEASRQELIELGVSPETVHTTSDPVMNFTNGVSAPPLEVRRKRVVVCLRHWFDTIDWLPVSVVNALNLRSAENTKRYDDFVAAMAKVLDHLALEPDAELTFVPFWGERDTKVHREVVAKMQHASRCKIIARSPTPSEASELIAAADFVVGMRLHSLILAVASCRPFFAIDYSKKVGDFLQEVLPGKLPLLAVSPVDLDPAKAIAALEQLAAARPFDANYAASVARLKEKERDNLALLRGVVERAGLLRG